MLKWLILAGHFLLAVVKEDSQRDECQKLQTSCQKKKLNELNATKLCENGLFEIQKIRKISGALECSKIGSILK